MCVVVVVGGEGGLMWLKLGHNCTISSPTTSRQTDTRKAHLHMLVAECLRGVWCGVVWCLGVQVLAGNYTILRPFPPLTLFLETVIRDALNSVTNYSTQMPKS